MVDIGWLWRDQYKSDSWSSKCLEKRNLLAIHLQLIEKLRWSFRVFLYGLIFFYLSRWTSDQQISLVQQTFPLVPDNRTNVIVEAWRPNKDLFLKWSISLDIISINIKLTLSKTSTFKYWMNKFVSSIFCLRKFTAGHRNCLFHLLRLQVWVVFYVDRNDIQTNWPFPLHTKWARKNYKGDIRMIC
jgi:hypothetical protein